MRLRSKYLTPSPTNSLCFSVKRSGNSTSVTITKSPLLRNALSSIPSTENCAIFRIPAPFTRTSPKGCTVPVAVWEVTEQDELALDHYEGFPNFYYKVEMTLEVKGFRTGKLRRRRAFVYIMREERPYGIPTSSYLSTCGQGYRFFGFPVDKLLEAHQYSRERMKPHERG